MPGRCDMGDRKALGVVGGLGPEGVSRFVELVERMGRIYWPGKGPEVIIRDFPQIPDGTGYLLGSNLKSPLPGLYRVSRELSRQNVGCIAIPCITAHYFYRELCDAVDKPIINPMEETARLLQEHGVECAGILATEATVQSGLFTQALERRGIRAVYPDAAGRERNWQCDGSTLEMLRRELENKGAEVTVLGCARLSAVKQRWGMGPGVLDVMEVMARAALRSCGRPVRPEYNRLITG